MKKFYLLVFMLSSFIPGKSYAQCLTPSMVPYFEGFQGITVNNQLPTCWAVSNTTTCLTFTNTSFANYGAFYYAPSGNSYFYSNALQLLTGITYSMASFFKTTFATATWTNFSMYIGPNQTTTGLTPVASTNSTVLNVVYTVLSNTFTVPSSGVYYAAIKGSSNGSSGSQYLFFDDFSITIPCTAIYNKPNVIIAATATNICSGDLVTFFGAGADTYTWSTGSTTFTEVVSPLINSTFSVTGTNTLTGCSAGATIFISVKPKPFVSVVPSNNGVICAGSSANLVAVGANTYLWNEGQTGSVIGVSPASTTSYTVTGTNAFGCSNTATVTIAVNPLPVVTVSNTSPPLCVGQAVTFTAAGASSYQWNPSSGGSFSGSSIVFIPNAATSTLTVFGTDNNNCIGRTDFILFVNPCTGLNNSDNNVAKPREAFIIYPNPAHGEFILESVSAEYKSIDVTDVIGKTVFTTSGYDEKIQINLDVFSSGIYLVKVSSNGSVNNLKIVKQ